LGLSSTISRVQELLFLSIQIPKGLPIMKLAIRIFAMSVVFAGAAAATVSSSSTRVLPSHQSTAASLPTPGCGPHVPTCPVQNPTGN